MTPCTARLGSILSAGIVLTSGFSIAYAARVTASPRAMVTGLVNYRRECVLGRRRRRAVAGWVDR